MQVSRSHEVHRGLTPNLQRPDAANSLPALSRVAAVLLLLLYCCYWWFFFGTHPESAPKDVREAILLTSSVASAATAPDAITASISKQLAIRYRERAITRTAKLHPFVFLPMGTCAAVLAVWLTMVALHNIHAVKKSDKISLIFVELVILPLATTTVENVISVLHARRRQMDWTIQATIVSSIGITLFVMPVSVCAGWATGLEAMTLNFNGFQVVLVFLTVLVVTSVFHGPHGRW